jgi:hypothetical protein
VMMLVILRGGRDGAQGERESEDRWFHGLDEECRTEPVSLPFSCGLVGVPGPR